MSKEPLNNDQIKTVNDLEITIQNYVINKSKEERIDIYNNNDYIYLVSNLNLLWNIERIENETAVYWATLQQVETKATLNLTYFYNSVENGKFIDILVELQNYYKEDFRHPKRYEVYYLKRYTLNTKKELLKTVKFYLKELKWGIKTTNVHLI